MNEEGRFQVAVGAVIVNGDKVLLIRRAAEGLEPGLWEYPAGRLKQFEDIEKGLRREVEEEVGLEDLKIDRPIRTFTYMRGGDAAENEVKGIVFVCRTKQKDIKLSPEHDQYEWLDFEEAIKRLSHEGIKQDVVIAREHVAKNSE
jgi:8-oxo-dGTP diphosphatase